MKTNIIGVINALVLAFAGAAAAWAQNEKVSEVRKVDAFSSIEIHSVGTVCFTQSDACSLKLEGKEKYVKGMTTTVKNGRLVVSFKHNGGKNRNIKEGVTIYLSAPDLKQVDFSGVGRFSCEEALKLDDVVFRIDGVGNLDVKDLTCNTLKVKLNGVGRASVNVKCDYLSAKVDGVGSVTLTGTAGSADISKGGIGSVNTRGLKIGR
ncbi:GIN domain-containing protein [Bacteroides heparinolyticus]|uniref:GIN domain-containing protein n=2 Tax=Prevotella heparinolytica TaxID=28113 RepID=UPI0035A152F0